MSTHVLIAPDKFKGTLTAHQVADAIAHGWRATRPNDTFELIPMSDGGDGFGEVLSSLLDARSRTVQIINAAHEPIKASWWWQPKSKTAIVESARVIGLAMLPQKKFHPFQLDTFGLGRVLKAAQNAGARECIIGIGGSATNDGGFGLARAMGWQFLDANNRPIKEWWQLINLEQIQKPAKPFTTPVTVAVDVRNPLLGGNGCSRVYGPQKGLRTEDFALAEKCLGRMASVLKQQHGIDHAKTPGAGAAGGLGFGLLAFLQARRESGFDIVAQHSNLSKRIAAADLVITGEGAIDAQTYMGKGVGQIAKICKRAKVPCIAMAGVVFDADKASNCFAQTGALTDLTSSENAKRYARKYLQSLAKQMATEFSS